MPILAVRRTFRLLTQGSDSQLWELPLFHLFRSPVDSDRYAASGRSVARCRCFTPRGPNHVARLDQALLTIPFLHPAAPEVTMSV
jgi:hypothetical protein